MSQGTGAQNALQNVGENMKLGVRKGFQKQMQKPTDCRGFELTLLCRLLLAQEKQVLTLLRKQVMSPNRASRR